jgi:predicted CXXCH cytochrome family protein
MRILGEIPLRKYDAAGNPIIDVDGNPDTSFLAKIPADVPFTFQTLDKHGLVLNMSQTWHQVRPGEVRHDCGGCHAHAQVGTDFALTAAAQPDYAIADLTQTTPLLQKNASGNTIAETRPMGAVDVEYYRDIKPILQRSCVKCHSKHGPAEAGLVLDDTDIVNGYENTYHRLANDPEAKYGRPPLIGTWRQSNASRYIRKFQSRRSLLIWKLFGRRLDGWTNDDHPTETVPGDKSTFPVGANPDDADLDFVGATMPPPDSRVPPLTEDEKMRFARWVDLGCPINLNEAGRKNYGWFLDDLRPTLTLSLPRAGVNRQPLTLIRIGAFDYYSGLDRRSLSVKANFPVNGERVGAELASLFTETGDHIWTMQINPALTSLPSGEITISIKDKQGNLTRLVRSFSIVTAISSESRRP